ncbi:MAG: hypothetical protein HY519_00430 [Candidatus Aenigmarchaeota archaeon]|nr:hypothetical protein [Candidatus Aenigmarchaeota archaeon]
MMELRRQAVHFSGIFLALAAWASRELVAGFCLAIGVFLFAYGGAIRAHRKAPMLPNGIEASFRNLLLSFERSRVHWPFTGAIWFFISVALAVILLPVATASATIFILSVGDGLSTVVGRAFGRHKLWGKSMEGSLAQFAGGLSAALFVPLPVAAAASFVAALAELGTGLPALQKFRRKGLVDDNWVVPLAAAAAMLQLA